MILFLQFSYLFCFFGFLGWIWETTFVSIKEKRYINRGFLRSPFIPIYSFGSLIIIYSLNYLASLFENKQTDHIIFVFFFTLFSCSTLEYLVSYLMELLFESRWWDYSYKRFHLNGRICLDYSIGWGIGGTILYFILYPIALGLFQTIRPQVHSVLLISIYLVLFVDLVNTTRELVTVRTVLMEMKHLTFLYKDKMSHFMRVEVIQATDDYILDFKEQLNKLSQQLMEKNPRFFKKYPNFTINRFDVATRSIQQAIHKFSLAKDQIKAKISK